ncbi:lipid droplet-associated protein [Amycolatopsis acidicola]|uniref:Lipid droplet-associated protein n=1 Tax=Amycolatopsis acidicola TaxID=2596893 RepID=A0A5N0VCH8_9PSEU|nr:lipid droplet-associated protein [Amycolatopsis acidicola]KAA9162322.1 lipid droplet-associated protein [Amycolatopsis acidicola]
MKPLPLPLRVAAGLAVTAAEHARELPKQVAGLPVTVFSQVLQFSMRLQQHVTELAIKGDEALSALRPVEETPSWATFDEDLAADDENPADAPPFSEPSAVKNGYRPVTVLKDVSESPRDPWEQEERALAEDHTEGEFDSDAEPGDGLGDGPVGLANYDEMTLPQLRARLRRFSLEQLEELLAYERAHANRPSFVGMLTRRIGNVQRLAESDGPDTAGL